MSAAERRKLIETPMTIRIIGNSGARWGGTGVVDLETATRSRVHTVKMGPEYYDKKPFTR